jgi:hypothetical protein
MILINWCQSAEENRIHGLPGRMENYYGKQAGFALL